MVRHSREQQLETPAELLPRHSLRCPIVLPMQGVVAKCFTSRGALVRSLQCQRSRSARTRAPLGDRQLRMPLARVLKWSVGMQPVTSLSMLHATNTWSESIGKPLAGGLLIGVAAALLLATLGRIAGISGILGGLVPVSRANFSFEAGWRLSFLVGLLSVGLLAGSLAPTTSSRTTYPSSIATLVVAGLLVGFGTRLGSGCTSGHGVCGISRLSLRSLVATLTFIVTGAATVAVVAAVGGHS